MSYGFFRKKVIEPISKIRGGLVFGSRLRNKFLLFFVISATAPLLVLGGTALYFIDLSHRQDVSNLELQLIDQKSEEIEKLLADTLGVLELRVGFTQKSEIDRSQQQFILESILQENRAFEEVSFTNLDGMETAKKARHGAGELFDISRLDKFLVARSGDNFISDIYYTLDGPFLTLSSPVRNRNDEIIQTLSAEVNLRAIVRSVAVSRLGSSGYLLLLDRHGWLAARGGRGEMNLGSNVSGFPRVARAFRGELMTGLERQDRYESMIDRTPVVGAAKKMSATGWVIFAEWPLVDSDAVIAQVRNQVVTLTLFSILAVLTLVSFFVSRLVKPLQALRGGAMEVAKGNFEKRVEIKTGDELEELGTAFNRMAQGLKELQELRDEFVFVAAHELRNPVTVIRGYVSIILKEAKLFPRKAAENLLQLNKVSEHLLQLVQDLLEVARSEAGRIVIAVAPLDIRVPIQLVLAEARVNASDKSITVTYRPLKSFPLVLANADRVKEIMMNLLSNATKYTPRGGTIVIAHEVTGSECITHVRDSGFGIPADEQHRLFQKFSRVITKDTRDIPGTGLGLFIVRELLEKMGGRIWIESQEGKGSTFSFALPLASKDAS